MLTDQCETYINVARSRYSSLYDFEGNPKLNVFNGMISVVDSAVGNLTAALKGRPGTWDNTIVRPAPLTHERERSVV
jgi:hypothetical protein